MTQTTDISRIVALAATISDATGKLQQLLSSHDQTGPSFDQDCTFTWPKEATNLQDSVLDATEELHDLLLEPLALLYKYGAHNNMVSLQAISRLKIARMVPVQGQTSFEDIATQTGLDVQSVQRILRHAMTMRIFREPEPGFVSHTRASKLLVEQEMNDWISSGSEEMWPAAVKVVDAFQKWPGSQEPTETAFALANNTTETAYQIIGSDPKRAMRFANAMKAFAASPGYEISYILDGFDWANLGPVHVVDIGGSQGNTACQLAARFSNLKITVQDMEPVIKGAGDGLPSELVGRVEFMAHDFFAQQPIQADVYYLRMVLHNWSDEYCIRLLRAQIPSLRRGAKIIIQDTVMPEPGTAALWKERSLRSVDLNMAAFFNARERTAGEWQALVEKADPRFALVEVIEPAGSALGIINVVWNANE